MIDTALVESLTKVKPLSPLDRERAFMKNEYGDPINYRFELESECGLTPQTIFQKALDILIAKMDELATAARQDDSSIKVTQDHGRWLFAIDGEDDTVGNLLQSTMHNYYLREKRENNVKVVSYFAPHPLQKSVTLSIHLNSDAAATSGAEAIDVFVASCGRVKETLVGMRDGWNAIAGIV